jgi:3-oxoacyl-[acyl-carrier-protein] synthase III
MSSADSEPVRPVVRAIAWTPGEQELSVDELCDMHQVSRAAIERCLGGRRAYVTERSALALAVDAGRNCLARAGLSGEELGGIIWYGIVPPTDDRPVMYLQHHLGAKHANPIGLAFNCTELVTALQLCRAMMRDDPELDRVLIAGGVVHGPSVPKRTVSPIREEGYETIFSDSAFAMLLERQGAGAQLVSFGNASVGALWRYSRSVFETPVERHGELPSVLQVLHQSMPAHQRALQQCLSRGGVTAAEIDHMLFPREPGGVERALMRQMGLDAKKLFDEPGGPSHTGVTDQVIGLERLVSSVAAPGARILLTMRVIGMMRCALLQMTPR